ncbi:MULTISPECIES: preprotein translocase subunit SecA [Thiomicrorhabdus]|uniref:Protein translocase subunit SecA n=1 Tax=Thiomicrorhabdus heinhorstiae TaxID=2748010 RepID=A0ABS0BYT2_9GAMM|nr:MULTISPECIES: preprotein translocase subunit SecA [Thiomicrorhabdus]MBF6058584.1 preprotein translocase subunit SecA [Thiomicrorhabdus heinhorstiae]
MAFNIFKKLFGSRNERMLKNYRKTVQKINALEAELEALSDEELRQKTDFFKSELAAGKSLDDILPEAFAVVREAGKRVFGMRHYDVQMIGGMALHEGKISEMRTGEGKTLVATLPTYLNALTGKGVHVITVNDYLAKRDSDWMGQLFEFLGLSTGVIISGQSPQEKQLAYSMDITYGTNNEFGFDYLRDNMAIFAEERVMRGQHYAVVDEVDSILIDEARTPLIISGPSEDKSEIYQAINPLIEHLEKGEEDTETKTSTGDFTIDEKAKQIYLTDQGHAKIEELLTEIGLLQEGDSLYDATNIGLMIHINAALRANLLFEKDRDYIVENNQVVIIDEFTGRKMEGRRWSEGLHQAVEAKEGVKIQQESQTFASITFQNYFRQYEKLSGMTGTADTEAGEFLSTYSLEVVVIPPNKTPQRIDLPDLVYLDMEGKFAAIVEDIRVTNETKQPILVGTASIEMSELLSRLLTQSGIKHNVLNAKQHEREAGIIADAGRPGAVTIATNMAGRGTDIVLGGNLEMEIEALDNPTEEKIAEVKAAWQARHDEVLSYGGLKVIGSERHESRRIDNQLRGRSGRQGDVGLTRFYLSLDDDLMRRFASERVKSMMKRLGMSSNEAIEHSMVTKSIERAQKQVERLHQDERANLLKFDDISNQQRKVVYAQRNELMAANSDDVKDIVDGLRAQVIEEVMGNYVPPGSLEEQWDIHGLTLALKEEFGVDLPLQTWLEEDKNLYEEKMLDKIVETMENIYSTKMSVIDDKTKHHFEKEVLLRTIDKQWRTHLAEMDYLRRGIHLRGYAQKDPFQEYRRESAEMFRSFLNEVTFETVKILSLVQIQGSQDVQDFDDQNVPLELDASHPAAAGIADAIQSHAEEEIEEASEEGTFRREQPKVGRNDPCPCGSGKKYKHCCGKLS